MEKEKEVEKLEGEKVEEKKDNKPEKKKSHPVLTTILIILLLIAFFGFGYAIGGTGIVDMVKKQQETQDEEGSKEKGKESTKEESVSFTESELEKYVNYISPIEIGISKLLYGTKEVKATELSAGKKIEYIGEQVYEKHQSLTLEQSKNEGKGKYDSFILESDVKKIVDEVYGPNTYEKTTFNLGCGDYDLDESTGKYYTKSGCGGTTAQSVSNVVIDYKATKSKLEITTAYAIFDGMKGKIFKDYDENTALDDYAGADTGTTEAYLQEYIKTNKDKLSHIIYTFESTDGTNYYFTGFVNNK